MTLPRTAKCKRARPPVGVRIGVPAAAAGGLSVIGAALAVALMRRRRNAPPHPAEHPPRVDDPAV